MRTTASSTIRPSSSTHNGKLHSRSFARKDDAQRWLTNEEASKLKGTWIDPSQSRQRFDDWADEWWEVWSSNPRRSPTTLEATENRPRRHVRPEFGRHALRAISVRQVQQWQDKLEATLGHESVMACRSILNRILQAAEDECLIPFNPLRKVKAPRRPVDPEVVFGRVQRRTLSPQEFGRLLAACPPFYRDHFIVHVGTGLRSGELLRLRPAASIWSGGASRSSKSATTPASSAPATRTGPRATPASASCRWPARWRRP
jgi:integrase